MAQFFDAAYEKLTESDPRFIDLLIAMLDEIEFDPYAAGYPHPHLTDLWVYETPDLTDIPRAIVLYEIDGQEKLVTLWSLSVR